jgi:hypothetical protein
MKNLRTHIWLCFSLGIFFLGALVMVYFVMIDMSQNSFRLNLTPEIIRIGFVNVGFYMVYVLIVLFKAIKYTPSTS